MTKLKLSKNMTSIEFNGKQYKAVKGIIEVPNEAVDILLSHGCELC